MPVPESTITRLAGWVLGHRRLVIVAWVVVFIAGGAGASAVSKRLSFDFSLPGETGYETAKKIDRLYGNGGDGPTSVVVVTLPAGQTVAAARGRLAGAFARARAAVPAARIIDYGATGDRLFVSRDGRSTFAIVLTPLEKSFGAPAAPAAVARALAGTVPPGAEVQLTGLGQLANGGSSTGPGVLVETLIGAGGALAVLAFVFASMLAFVPLLIAAVSILSTLLVILGLTTFTDVSFIVQFLVSLVGLGVAIDYSLLIVTRWRKERGRGGSSAIGGRRWWWP